MSDRFGKGVAKGGHGHKEEGGERREKKVGGMQHRWENDGTLWVPCPK